MKQKLVGFLAVFFFLYFSVALYGKHHNCTEAGGVLVAGILVFQCVQEVPHD